MPEPQQSSDAQEVHALLNAGAGKVARPHRGRGDGRECGRGLNQRLKFLFSGARLTTNQHEEPS